MLYKFIAAEITEALAEAMLDVAKEEVTGALAKEAQKKMRLQDKTYDEWKDLIFTIAFTGNFPKDDRVAVLANHVNAAHQRIDALEKQLEKLKKSLEENTDYLRSEIFEEAEKILYSSIAHEDNLLKGALKKINKSFSASNNNLKHDDQARDIANYFAEHILEEEANYRESITKIFTTLMPSEKFDNANLLDVWKSAAIFHSESSTIGKANHRFDIYKEMEREFASILLLQLRYMQVLLDSYRVHQANPLPVKTHETPQQFLNDFYKNTFEPEVSAFVTTVEQWIINVFPYPLSPTGRVEIPEDIRKILAQVNYFAEKTLKPIQEYVTIFNWNDSLAQQTADLGEYLQKTVAIAPLKPLQKRDDYTLETTGDAGSTQRTVALRRVASTSMPNYDGTISLTVDGKLCQTYRYQSGEVSAIAQPEALQGRILIPGDRWRSYQNKSTLLVRLVDSSSGGHQFEAIGRLEFQSVKFLLPEQKGALRGLGLLVGGRWKYYPELLMAKFVPHHTLTDLVPAGSISLDIRDFDTNRVLQRVTALFTAAEGTAQAVTRRSFTTFMTTGVDVVAWARSPVAA